MRTNRLSFATLAHAAELASRNLDPRAFRPQQFDLLRQQLEEAALTLREMIGHEEEIRALIAQSPEAKA